MIKSMAILCFTVAFFGCGGDDATEPVQYSEPVGINLKAKSSDVVNGTISEEKGINTETGNPYGAFIANARRELGGIDPVRIELGAVKLLLGGTTTGVTGLGQVFTGDVVVQFQMNDTNNSFPAAERTFVAADGAGPIDSVPAFDSTTAASADYAKLLAGSFKVVLRGPAEANFRAANADADLQVTLTFIAYDSLPTE